MPNIKTRIQNKHDTEANWALAENFRPLAGEVIVYDADASHTYPRFKVGDGETVVSALPFSTVEINTVEEEGVAQELDNIKIGGNTYSVPSLTMSVSDVASDTSTTIKTLTIDGDQYNFYSEEAGHASTADQAVNADYATNANHANSASQATIADSVVESFNGTVNGVPFSYVGKYPSTMGEIYAPTTAGIAGYYLKSNGSGAPTWAEIPASSSSPFFGTCSTSASTSAKTVTITDFTSDNLVNGTKITVYFTYNNTSSSPTLNVSGTGAKNMVTQTGTELTGTVGDWAAGSVVSFVYYNNEWVLQSPTLIATLNGTEYFAGNSEPTWYAPTSAGTSNQLLQSNGSGAPTWVDVAKTYYGYCSTSDTTNSKTVYLYNDADYVELKAGNILIVDFTYGSRPDTASSTWDTNYGAITLSVPTSSSGTRTTDTVYYKGSAINRYKYSFGWDNNQVVTFMYNSSGYWEMIAGGSGYVAAQAAKSVSAGVDQFSEVPANNQYDKIVTVMARDTRQYGRIELHYGLSTSYHQIINSCENQHGYWGVMEMCLTAFIPGGYNAYIHLNGNIEGVFYYCVQYLFT